MRYTEHIVSVVERMVREGASNKEIAMAIGTTENRLQSRMSQLGIKRDVVTRQNNGGVSSSISVRVPTAVARKYVDAAIPRRMKSHNLIRLVLKRVAQDNLFTAILDDGK